MYRWCRRYSLQDVVLWSDNMAAPGGRTRPLRCFAIRVLSSDSWRLRDGDSLRMWFRGRSEVPAKTFASLIPPASPAPPIYEVMGDHGSPPGPLTASWNTRFDNSSGLKRFLPDKLFKMSILSGHRPFYRTFFWFGANVSGMPADIRIFGNVAASVGRPRPLRCFAIRGLSSASRRLRGVDGVSVGIGRVENLV